MTCFVKKYMEITMDLIVNNKVYIATGAGVLAVTIWLCRRYRRRKRVCGVDYPRDTVILYGGPSHMYIPNFSHFAMKLETYCRISRIPYKTYFVFRPGPKHKVPWIEYNGTTMGDSQMIIEFLNKEFDIDMNKHLSKPQQAYAWAIQKWLEEFTYWLVSSFRGRVVRVDDVKSWRPHTERHAVTVNYYQFLTIYCGLNLYSRAVLADEMFDIMELSFLKRFLANKLGMKRMISALYTMGVGRHTKAEVFDMIVNDLKQFSIILGSKQFIMGDTITEVDCAAFGILSEVRWGTPHSCPGYKLLTGGELQNVCDYLDRIKQTYWTDWDELCQNKNNRI